MARRAHADLRSYTGFLLRRAFVAAVGIEAGCIGDDARAREITVLTILDELGAVSQREVAELTHISPTLVVGLVDALVARGWVQRERSEADRRSYALLLTDAGRGELPRLERELVRSEAELTAGLGDDDVSRLRAHLRLLLDGDPALRVTGLADRVGYLIGHAHGRVRERAQQALRQFDLHPRDFGLLAVVARDQPCSQSHLATSMGVSDPAILPVLESLEARGLLTRERNDKDRRLRDVRLTPQGLALFERAQDQATDVQAEIVGRLGRQANADLCALLSRIVDR